MKRIERLVHRICEELEDAKNYAECAIDFKVSGDSAMSNKYKDMAADELRHAQWNHDYAVSEINKLQAVYTPPVEMEEEWERTHKTYIEKTAWIKKMLEM